MKKLLFACLAMLWCGVASADPILGTLSMDYQNWNGSNTVQLHFPGNNPTVRAGNGLLQNNQSQATGIGTAVANGAVNFFCMDVFHNVNQNLTTYDIVPLTDSARIGFTLTTDRINKVQKLFGTHYNGTLTNTAKRDAFGLCLWELMTESNDNPLNVTNGTFWTSGYNGSASVITDANTILAGLSGPGTSWNCYSLVPQGGGQRFMMAQVPEPATLINLLGLAGLGLGFAYYRRRRSH